MIYDLILKISTMNELIVIKFAIKWQINNEINDDENFALLW